MKEEEANLSQNLDFILTFSVKLKSESVKQKFLVTYSDSGHLSLTFQFRISGTGGHPDSFQIHYILNVFHLC